MDRFEARKEILEALGNLDLYKGKSEHAMTLPICSRSGDVIEPRIKEQWYVDCSEMAGKAAQAVRQGRLKLIPDIYAKQWYDWLENPNTSSWCISRQLWWGHRIPAYKVVQPVRNSRGDTWVVARSEDEAKEKAASQLKTSLSEIQLQQDEDVLDTWFSSGIFPFSIFGWPEETPDMISHYPTDLLETASDILFFWVARMVMLGEKLTGQLPFNKVLLHSILRDSHGRKMSKSLGNIIDPLDVITGISLEELNDKLQHSNLTKSEVKKAEAGQKKDFPLGIPECGTDALRFSLCGYHYNAHFTNVDVTHIQSNRNFCNKIWQAFKFCSTYWPEDFSPMSREELTDRANPTDLWMLSRLSTMVHQCNESFESLELYKGTKAIHTFWWGDFCDLYLEYTKSKLVKPDDDQRAVILTILYMCVNVGLRCASPLMPFLTEELYQRLPGAIDQDTPSICVAQYPTPSRYSFVNSEVENEMELVKHISSEVRTLRKALGLTKAKVPMFLVCSVAATHTALNRHSDAITTLTRSASVDITSSVSVPRNCVEILLTPDLMGYLHIQDIVHVENAISNLETSIQKIQGNIIRQEKKVSENLGSDDVWCTENQKLTDLKDECETLRNIHGQLKNIKK